eukprot:scaffold2986_cov406-Prasinococcus_capsulatus_cf.AAC.8
MRLGGSCGARVCSTARSSAASYQVSRPPSMPGAGGRPQQPQSGRPPLPRRRCRAADGPRALRRSAELQARAQSIRFDRDTNYTLLDHHIHVRGWPRGQRLAAPGEQRHASTQRDDRSRGRSRRRSRVTPRLSG